MQTQKEKLDILCCLTSQVSSESTSQVTRCLCDHLTSFAAGVFVPPNSINFATVFTDLGAKLRDNNSVLASLAVIVVLYIVTSVWARRMDKKDVEKV